MTSETDSGPPPHFPFPFRCLGTQTIQEKLICCYFAVYTALCMQHYITYFVVRGDSLRRLYFRQEGRNRERGKCVGRQREKHASVAFICVFYAICNWSFTVGYKVYLPCTVLSYNTRICYQNILLHEVCYTVQSGKHSIRTVIYI